MTVFPRVSTSEPAPRQAFFSGSVLGADEMRAAKAATRKHLLARRSALSPSESMQLSEQIQSLVLASQEWRQARSLALYVAARQEVSTDLLLDAAWAQGKKVFLPRCLPKDPAEAPHVGGRMVFALCRSRADLGPGVFGLQEPLASCTALFPLVPQEGEALPEFAIVPLVGLRPDGARLGYGGGYYDRAFGAPKWNAVRRLALAYAFQITQFPAHEAGQGPGRDVFMHGYATEEGLLWL